MSEALPPPVDRLIGMLARDLRPVRRLLPPWQRVLAWLSAVAWLGVLLSLPVDMPALIRRLGAAPDMWLSQAGAVATCVAAGWAALRLCVPGSSAGWAWLPAPALLLWIAAAAAGCLRPHGLPGTLPPADMHPLICLRFILLVALPLGAGLVALLARACPLRPGLVSCLAGLASAAASCSLLVFWHPFDAEAGDLLVHAGGVLAAVALIGMVAGRWLGGGRGRRFPA